MSIPDIRAFLDATRPERERTRALRAVLELKASALADQLNSVQHALAEWCDPSDETVPLEQVHPGSHFAPIALAS